MKNIRFTLDKIPIIMISVMIMNEFMNYDFVINKITFAGHLKLGEGMPIHRNRQNHDLAFYSEGTKTFISSEYKEKV